MTRKIVCLRRVQMLLAALLMLFPVGLLLVFSHEEFFVGSVGALLAKIYFMFIFGAMLAPLSLPKLTAYLLLGHSVRCMREPERYDPYQTVIHGVTSLVSAGAVVWYGKLFIDDPLEGGIAEWGTVAFLLLALHCLFFLVTLVLQILLWRGTASPFRTPVGAVLTAVLAASALAFQICVWVMNRSVALSAIICALALCLVLNGVASVVARRRASAQTGGFFRIGGEGENRSMPTVPGPEEYGSSTRPRKKKIIVSTVLLVLAAGLAIFCYFEFYPNTQNVFDQIYYDVRAEKHGRDTVLTSGTRSAYADYDFGTFQYIAIPEQGVSLSIEGDTLYIQFSNHDPDADWRYVLYKYRLEEKRLYGERPLEFLVDNFLNDYFWWHTKAGQSNAYSPDDLGEYEFEFQENVYYD